MRYKQLIEDAVIVSGGGQNNKQAIQEEKKGSKKVLDIKGSKALMTRIYKIHGGTYSVDGITTTKNTVKGMVIGGVLGLALGMYFKKNLVFTTLMGGFGGALANHLVNKINLD